MRVLVLTSVFPLPAHRGDPLRILGILDALHSSADVTLWATSSGEAAVAELTEMLPGLKVRLFQKDSHLGGDAFRNALRYLWCLIRGIPSWIYKHRSTSLVAQLTELQDDWDVIIALAEPAAQYTVGLRRPWHWDKFNVLTASRRGSWRGRLSLQERVSRLVDYGATRRFEFRHARRAASVSVTNEEEASRFEAIFDRPPHVIRSAVPLPAVVQRSPRTGQLVWLGNFEYKNNWDGLVRFLEQGWPPLNKRCQLLLVGSGITAHQERALRMHEGVHVLGFVEDLAKTLGESALGVVPVWSGGGTKMKTLTMLAHGLPLVSTRMGLEGLPHQVDPPYYAAETPEEMAQTIQAALVDPSLEAKSLAARELIEAHFSTTAIADACRRMLTPQKPTAFPDDARTNAG
jgi:glycosyltransferase involved in cell wall biosynthesis